MMVTNSREFNWCCSGFCYILDVDACGLNPCQNGATCTDTMGSYSCGPCPTPVTGYNCERRTYIYHQYNYKRVLTSFRKLSTNILI